MLRNSKNETPVDVFKYSSSRTAPDDTLDIYYGELSPFLANDPDIAGVHKKL